MYFDLVCLTQDGKVYSWGCNDDGALGRLTESTPTETVVDEYNADRIKGSINNQKIVQISCGDSHSAALTDDGQVYVWGTFRNANGNIGLLKENCTERFPVHLKFPFTNEKPTIIKITSGNNHLCCLSSDGRIFTCGNWEQGQLGRDCEQEFTKVEEFKEVSEEGDDDDGEENGGEKTYFQKCLDLYLKPIAIEISTAIKFDDCWTGSYCTFARTKKTKEIFACGLNNYFQLNIDPKGDDRSKNENLLIKEFTKWKGLPLLKKETKYVNSIASGEHHSLFICSNGGLYSIGNHNYGRLGLGNSIRKDVEQLQLNPIFNSFENKIKKISTSASSVLGISSNNRLYGWGMADCHQITFKNDTFIPTQIQTNGDVIDCAVGAQHSLFIVK